MKRKLITFNNATPIDKFLYNLSIITICAFISNIYIVSGWAYFEKYPSFSKIWFFVLLTLLLIIGREILLKLKLKITELLAASFFSLIIFIIGEKLFPIKIPNYFTGLRLSSENGNVKDDLYCFNGCNSIEILINDGYEFERGFYSWRYAELMGRNNIGIGSIS